MCFSIDYVAVDKNLNFYEYVFDLCKIAGRKLSILARLTNYMSFEKKKILLKAFVESKFEYCPLRWVFHCRRANSKINNIHERAQLYTKVVSYHSKSY